MCVGLHQCVERRKKYQKSKCKERGKKEGSAHNASASASAKAKTSANASDEVQLWSPKSGRNN